jgi:hypothetical protein
VQDARELAVAGRGAWSDHRLWSIAHAGTAAYDELRRTSQRHLAEHAARRSARASATATATANTNATGSASGVPTRTRNGDVLTTLRRCETQRTGPWALLICASVKKLSVDERKEELRVARDEPSAVTHAGAGGPLEASVSRVSVLRRY